MLRAAGIASTATGVIGPSVTVEPAPFGRAPLAPCLAASGEHGPGCQIPLGIALFKLVPFVRPGAVVMCAVDFRPVAVEP